jgi:tRNA threonylcarbamoyladenosine biosynthesis protein TsaB
VRVLALDTATRATAVAACDGERHAERRDDPPPGARPGHARRILPLAAEAIAALGWKWGDVERIAVGRGPGTFTGLRIGIATAHGLASSLGVALAGISSLEALALPALATAPASVLAVLDARRGEAFAAAYSTQPDGDRRQLAAPQVLTPEALAALAAGLPDPLAVGDGAVEFTGVLERAGATVAPVQSALHRVSAVAHCRLAREAPLARPADVLPEYLRLPDAELARRARTDGS